MPRAAIRYYVYSPTLGRRRVPPHYEDSDHHARYYAEHHNQQNRLRQADNLIREDGPLSKPHSVTVIWEREPEPPATDVALDAAYALVLADLRAHHADSTADLIEVVRYGWDQR